MTPPDDDSTDEGPTNEKAPYQDDPRLWWSDPELQRERKRNQVDLILASLPESRAHNGDDSDDNADMEYMYRWGVILVRDQDLARVHAALGDDGPLEERIDRSLINGLTAYRPPDEDTQAALRRIDERLGMGVATPDHVLFIAGNPGGCCPATEPLQPGQDNPDPDINRDTECSGRGVFVSVVDTGLAVDLVTSPKHQYLEGVTGDAEVVNPAQLGHYVGHGTFIAGVVRCMAPESTVRVEGFLTQGGAIFESAIVEQLDQALLDVPDIISLSAGTWTRSGLDLLGFEVFYESRLRHLKGTVLVAAAGNDGNRGPFWPAAFPWTVSVGALDIDGQRAKYSNFGSWVDVYARGSEVVNAFPDGFYTYAEAPHKGQSTTFTRGMATWSGTSFATPLVSGLIAARMSRTGESARLAADALLRLARANATPGVGPVLEPGMGCVAERCGCCCQEEKAEEEKAE